MSGRVARSASLVLATGSLLALCAQADAGERPWYVGLEGGVEFDGGAYGRDDDSGWAGLVTVGTGITSHINLEAELGYRSVSTVGFYGYDTHIDQTTLMLNAVYETPISKEVSFAVGLGVGGDHVSRGRDNQVAAQLKLGLSVALSEDTELVANYRYVEVFRTYVDNSTVSVGIRFAL